jgi:replicative DNA helicase
MDIERALVTKLVFTGQIEEAISRNINEDHFADEECRDMYRYLVSHTRKYKSCPSLEVAKTDRPDFEWLQMQDSLDFLLDRFTVQVKRRMADDILVEVAQAADDRERAENIDIELLEAAQKLIQVIPSGKVARYSEMEQRIVEQERRQAEGRHPGIPFGFPTLDRLTDGIKRHELISVLGFTNVGKSTLLRVLAFNFYLKGYHPLYFSLEMEAEDILRVFDVMGSRIDYAKMRQLSLDPHDIKEWRKVAERVKNTKNDISIIDSMYRITPDNVYAETLRHKPDVVIVDYVGLMRSSNISRGVKRYQQLSEITQDLKIYARRLRTPIIMAAQTNREGAKGGAELANVADAISISQDSDIVIGLFQDEEMEERKEMEIRLSKNRQGPRKSFKARWDHELQDFREQTIQDRMRREDRDPEPKPTGTGFDKWMENRVSGFARAHA